MMLSTRSVLRCLFVIIPAVCLGQAGAGAEERAVSYSRDIKPILSNRCYACHGPDAKQRQADLRLDLRDVAIESAIVPGSIEDSPLLDRITTVDPDEQMPPPDSKLPRLTEKEVDLLRRWIQQGANFDAHWAYVNPLRRELPKVDAKAWPINAVDHFIAAGHKEHGFKPSADADRRTLIRRLSFDLTGLPPTADEVAAFAADEAPDAYEKLVMRLLASKHYGERMAMYWLDAVRYADTNGIHGDNHRDHDLYRDYVINAFNDNMPFDRFTYEQLGGDLIPGATNEQRIASGYNRLNMTTREGGAQAKEYRAKYAADRVRNASTVWLGSTLGCAECHDHKFDPFTTKDFYSFAAFFADIQETAVGTQSPTKLPTLGQSERIKQIDAQLAELQKQLASSSPELEAARRKWEDAARAELAKNQPAWQVVKPEKLASSGGAALAVQDDLSVLSSGANPAKDTYTLTLKTKLKRVTGIRLEALKHPSLAAGGLSRGNGNFVLTRFEVELAGKPVTLTAALADHSQQGFPVASAIDGKATTGWAVEGHAKKENRKAVFTLAEPITADGESVLTVRLRHESQHNQHNIGCFRLSLTGVEKPGLSDDALPGAVAAALAAEPGKQTPQQKKALADYFRQIAPSLKTLRDESAKLEAEKKQLGGQFRPILVAMAGQPRQMRVLPRGNWLDDSGEVVAPAVPGFMKQITVTDRRPTRLDLAAWIIDPENPMTARVFVNRLWKLMFGRGIVTSLDDYGVQGTVPSHPELLDWLAVEFVESGWDVKHMVKLMVMSRTYQQSSFESKDTRRRDPANQWLSRQNRYRIDAEMVRDNALSIARLLITDVGGRSVKPYQPSGYWAHLNFPKRAWQHDGGESQYRRGLYTYWCRTFLHPSLLAFDAPSREESCVERPRSNTPLQALVLLNDPTYVEAARVFAQRIMSDKAVTTEERLDFAFREALGRKPKPAEIMILAGIYEKHRAEYEKDEAAAGQAISIGQSKAPAKLNQVELAAWTSVARVILNLHETITRY